jgi:SAM-dependent methyltransferase
MEIANVDQAAQWDGPEGDDWTEHADRYDAVGSLLEARIAPCVVISPTDDVLDVGCGTGLSTRRAARAAVDGTALGVDLSARMLDLARARAAADGLTNVTYLQADAQVHRFDPASRDLLISEFGAMFFSDAEAAFANLGTALRPGGRLAITTWRSLRENEWLVTFRTALAAGRDLPEPPTRGSSPFSLSEPDHVRSVLMAAGYQDVELTPFDEPMVMGKDAGDALDFARTMGIYRGLTDGLDAASVAEATDRLQDALAAAETPDGVLLGSATWLITASVAS